MGFVQQQLSEAESVVYTTGLHWVVFLSAAVFAFLALVLLAAGAGKAAPIAMLAAVVLGFRAWIKRMTAEFAVTDRRVILKTGLVERHAVMMLLDKIESITVDQGILGRVWDYGTVKVTGSGGGKEVFTNVAQPMEFRRQVEDAIRLSSPQAVKLSSHPTIQP